jgi:plasmid stability protein
MATLNVKNLSDELYEKLKKRSRRSRRSIAQEVSVILSRALAEDGELSVTSLRGLGKELWADEDAATHVRKEREAWD